MVDIDDTCDTLPEVRIERGPDGTRFSFAAPAGFELDRSTALATATELVRLGGRLNVPIGVEAAISIAVIEQLVAHDRARAAEVEAA